MKRWLSFCIWLTVALITACSVQAERVDENRVRTETITERTETEAAGAAVFEVEVTRIITAIEVDEANNGDSAADLLASAADGPMSELPLALRQPQRLIIKNADMSVIVRETDRAVDQAVQVAVDYGGYVIGQRVWDGSDGHRYASLSMAVPVTHFEVTMRALRTLGQVTSETASGQDVTDEFVDLNSRLGNLQATQTRLRTFLEQATNITETLRVHEELRLVEEEIGVIQGRMNYLQDRAAFSTIRLNLNPWIPTPTPSPTPTMTPTPTPTPTMTPTPIAVWQPGDTAAIALGNLQETSQVTADFFIYYGIVCGPWLLLLGLLALVAWRVYLALERPLPGGSAAAVEE